VTLKSVPGFKPEMRKLLSEIRFFDISSVPLVSSLNVDVW